MRSEKKVKGLISAFSVPTLYWELLIIGTALMTGMSLPSSFLPIMATDLDPSGVLVGLVVSAWFFSRIFLEFPAGLISDRVGHRRLLIFGMALSAFGPLLCSLATNIWMLIVGRGIWGLGTSLYFMNNMAMLMEILPQNIRGKALGIFQGIEFLGSFLGSPIGAFLAAYLSFYQVFWFTLALTIVSLIIALISGNLKKVDQKGSSKKIPSIKEIILTLKDYKILAICAGTFIRMLVIQGIFQTILQLYLKKVLYFNLESIGLIVGMKILGQIPALIGAGILSDKLGRLPVLISGFGITCLSLILFPFVNSFELVMLITFISGIGEGLDMTTLMALLSDIAPQNLRGGIIGLYRTFMDLGGFMGPILFMISYEGIGTTNTFLLGAALCFINVIIFYLMRSQNISSS